MLSVCAVSGTWHVTKSACPQQFVEAVHGFVVSQRQLRHGVKIDHVHAEHFGQDADLRADVTVTYDADGFAAHFI